MSFPVTSLLAALFALMMVALSLSVSLRRIAVKTASSAPKDDVLRARIRAHGNFSEYAPLMLVVLGLVEAAGAPAALAWSLGAAFATARVAHATGMLYASTPRLRGGAMVLQHLALLVAGGWLLLRFAA
jgi:uncharacterized membrane protein YecN with MAPEG domain